MGHHPYSTEDMFTLLQREMLRRIFQDPWSAWVTHAGQHQHTTSLNQGSVPQFDCLDQQNLLQSHRPKGR